MEEIELNTLYRHYKGNLYKTLYLAKHTETDESLIVYQSISDNKVWCRPTSMWNEDVMLNGKITKRFTKFEE